MLCLEPPGHFSDVDHPVTGTLYGRLTTADLKQIIDHRPAWRGLLAAVVAFRENDPISIGNHSVVDESITLTSRTTDATIGQEPVQEAIFMPK